MIRYMNISIELIARIKESYKLRWTGIHGILHWNRVYENGIRLSAQEGVNVRVIQFFSIFHDCQRKNEYWDKYHGMRGARFAEKNRELVSLNDVDFELLLMACELHTSEKNHDNVTIQACFDADRLDLGRVGRFPDPKRLCTPLAKKKETIEWAYQRSKHQNTLPEKPFGLG